MLQVSEDDLTQALTSACICCILAKAGPQRSRILANLYKDERTRALPIFPFLQKVYLERILRQEEVCAPLGIADSCAGISIAHATSDSMREAFSNNC